MRLKLFLIAKFSGWLLTTFLPYSTPINAQLPRLDNIPEFQCSEPILSRLQTHIVQTGETLETIANSYGVTVETIISLNATLQNNSLTVGQKLEIPPFNGIKVKVPTGVKWRDIAEAYGVRQDVLFELNGCVKNPDIVFIPGVNWTAITRQEKNYQGLSYHPLGQKTTVGLNYGWQENQGDKFFHSGVDLLAPLGSSVLAVEDGIVVFVGNEPNYGFVIIINHNGGRQTRYAHLSRVNVKIEDNVKAGNLIGQVGNTGNPDLPQSHLHFEVRIQTPQGWITQDPLLNLPQN